MFMYGLINYQGSSVLVIPNTEKKNEDQKILRRDLDFLAKQIDECLSKHKKAYRTKLFWDSFRNTGPRVSYDWLSSDKK